MSENHLLLSSARSGVLVVRKERPHWTRRIVISLGVLAVVVGGADVAARFSKNMFGDRASFIAFAPAILLVDPALGGLATTSSVSFEPVRLKVSALGINAEVENVGKKPDGSMATPSTFYTVGWYKLGVKPGQEGNAVFAGHVNNALTTAGVFEHLGQISLGDSVEVFDKEGQKLTFIVEKIDDYPKDNAPLEGIFATKGPSRVVLITCDGDWDPKAHSFDKRLVVVARRMGL